MRKTILVGVMTTLALSLFVVATTTGSSNVQSAYADPDLKEKSWVGEGGDGASSLCVKDSNCKGTNVNKDARETCEDFTDSKCKMRH